MQRDPFENLITTALLAYKWVAVLTGATWPIWLPFVVWWGF